MVVWGGEYLYHPLNSGGRYDPSNDRWLPTSMQEAPPARSFHTSVWTGNKMIVWGGRGPDGYGSTNSGGGYDPLTDTWEAVDDTSPDVPSPRLAHTALWTGREMIVWGGQSTTSWNTGGRYDPKTNHWTPTNVGENVPAERASHSAVWTGTEMIIWGGQGRYPNNGHYLRGGGRYCYNPCTQLDADMDGTGDLCDFTLLSPPDASTFSSSAPAPTFIWSPEDHVKLQVQFSTIGSPFKPKTSSKKLKGVTTFTPTAKQWKVIQKMARSNSGDVVYWRVVGQTAGSAMKTNSDQTFSFSFSSDGEVASTRQQVENGIRTNRIRTNDSRPEQVNPSRKTAGSCLHCCRSEGINPDVTITDDLPMKKSAPDGCQQYAGADMKVHRL